MADRDLIAHGRRLLVGLRGTLGRQEESDLAALLDGYEQALDESEQLRANNHRLREMFRDYMEAIPDETPGKVYRTDIPEIFGDDDGSALYLEEAKPRLLAMLGDDADEKG